MTSVANHYESLLAPIYLWTVGGMDHALSVGAADLAEFVSAPGNAVDLGAGFGMHSIPLARAGFRVLAIDTSAYLLEQLRQHSTGLPVMSVRADLREFARHISSPADLIICMGDTLTHLTREEEIGRLLRDVAASLRPGGRFVATFRDYRRLPSGEKRFIPVRGDRHRIHTCFLEQAAERVIVHDIVQERCEDGWSQSVSSYEKLRLSPGTVIQAAERAGLSCLSRPGPRGMLTVLARR
jgi:2-polyprenyl-3-methyl-5-hydroxy-6-metoxy-1,4-benzoquinol methylase